MFYELRSSLVYRVTQFCLWIIKKINRHKDRTLAKRLSDVAELYDPRGFDYETDSDLE